MRLLPFALLATLVASTALPEAEPEAEAEADGSRLLTRAENQWITWRGGEQGPNGRNLLMYCGGGPYVGYRNGDKLSLGVSTYFKYCSPWFSAETSQPSTSFKSGYPELRCIDSTLYPGNGVKPHMWQCYDGVWQQKWKYRSDGLIELVGHGLCLDVTDGDPLKEVQLWECSPGNPNQQWNIGTGPGSGNW